MPNKPRKKWQLLSENASAKAKDVQEIARARVLRVFSDLATILLSPWKFFKIVCFTIGLCVMAGSVALSVYVHRFFKSIPHVEKLTTDDLQRMGEAVVNRRLETKGSKSSTCPACR